LFHLISYSIIIILITLNISIIYLLAITISSTLSYSSIHSISTIYVSYYSIRSSFYSNQTLSITIIIQLSYSLTILPIPIIHLLYYLISIHILSLYSIIEHTYLYPIIYSLVTLHSILLTHSFHTHIFISDSTITFTYSYIHLS